MIDLDAFSALVAGTSRGIGRGIAGALNGDFPLPIQGLAESA